MSWRCEECRIKNDDDKEVCICGCPRPVNFAPPVEKANFWVVRCPECDNEIVVEDENSVPDCCDNCGNTEFDDCEAYQPSTVATQSITPQKKTPRLYLREIKSIKCPGDDVFRIPYGINAQFISDKFYIPDEGGYFGADNLTAIDDRYDYISSKHVKFSINKDGVWSIKDNESTNGTIVGYKKIRYYEVKVLNEQLIQLADRLFVAFIEEQA